MNFVGGFNVYGRDIGILLLETSFPRIPGDIGNSTTFDFPVNYKVVFGATSRRVVQEQDPKLLKYFIQAAQELESEGVRAITTSCGYLVMFQKEIANAVNIPVFTSSLLQIPVVFRMLRKEEKVGIVVANKKTFNEKIINSIGATNVPIVIAGMEEEHEFNRIRKVNEINTEKAEVEVVNVVMKLIKKEPLIKAIVLECANLPPYSRAIQKTTGMPVFDIVTLTKWVYSALIQNAYMENI